MPDKEIVCNTCGNPFVFNEKEQEFFRIKGLLIDPKHCVDCRRKRRAEKQQLEAAGGQVDGAQSGGTATGGAGDPGRRALTDEEKRRRFGMKARTHDGQGLPVAPVGQDEYDDVWRKP